MFPIRKRKATYGTFTAKKAKYDNNHIMAAYRRGATKRTTRFKRRTPYNKRGGNGAFFNPKSSQPPLNRKPWEWLTVRLNHNQGAATQDIQVTTIESALNAQLGFQPAAIKISSVQCWNQAGVGASANDPYLEVRPRSLIQNTQTEIGQQEDFGNLNQPARLGYKWSQTESQIPFQFGNTHVVYQIVTNNGERAYSFVKIQYYK